MNRTLRVLHIEDDERDATLLVRQLTQAGYKLSTQRVETAEAMQAALTDGEWDLILCDYTMPQFNAHAALKILEETKLDVPFIIISGTIGEEIAVEAMRAGANDYLMKDKLARLVPTIEREIQVARNRRDKRKTEQALRNSEARLRAILETASDAIIIIDVESNLQYFNQATSLMFGYSQDELFRQKLTLLMPEQSHGQHLEGIQRYLESGERTLDWRSLEVVGRHKDGTDIPLEVSFSEFTENNGRFFTGIIRNNTERKQAEELLRHSQERYRDLVENAHDIIYAHDLDGNFLAINSAAEQITGYTTEEFLEMNLVQTVVPEQYAKAKEMVARMLKGERVTAYELEIWAKDGRRIAVEVNTRLVFQDGEPVGVQGIARDITERKHLEEQLLQAQKLESLGRLAGGIAHDFNNMLTAINGYSDLVLRRIAENDPIRPNIREIKKAGDRAAVLTNQLLAFSRRQMLKPELLLINDTIAETSNMLKRLIGEDIELETILKTDVGQIKADPGRLSQILLNLAVNARDAMPEGGKLTIETGNIFIDAEYSHSHFGVLPGAYVMLAVSDTGIGMNQDLLEQVFEPFFTTKEVGKGTGLGLSTVYGIVKQSGGGIFVYSEVGHGTTFKVFLPRVIDGSEAALTNGGAAKLPVGTETILLVEDEEIVRTLSREVLEACGYTVLEAVDGVEALEVFESSGDNIDLVITDVVMPRIGGRELVQKLFVMRPGLPVLFASGYTDDAIVRHGVLEPNVNFIQKPFTLDDVARKVRDLLDSSQLR